MFAQRAGNFLHGFEAAAQEMFAPYIQETCHAKRRLVLSEVQADFLQL